MSRQLFSGFDWTPRESLRQLGAKIMGQDFTNETELLDLDDQVSALWGQICERGQRVQAWLDANDLNDLMRDRLIQRLDEASNNSVESMFNMLLHKGDPTFAHFLSLQDPIAIQSWLIGSNQEVDAYVRQIQSQSLWLNMVSSMVEALYPTAQVMARTHALEIVRFKTALGLVYMQQTLRMLDRIEHGIPEWDTESGCEKPLDIELPAFGETPVERQIKQEIEQQQVNDLFDRLTNGIFPR